MELLLLAVTPAMVIIGYIYIRDKFEKEPFKLLVINFFLGAVVSVLITIIFGTILGVLLPVDDEKSIFQMLIKAFIIVALIEEFSKYVIVRYVAQRSKEFNEPFDGIIYAVMVSMGFATLENVIYVFQYGVATGITRAFTAVPAHATFAILMGYYMGKAKFSKNSAILNLTGLFTATFFHGAYDFFLFVHYIPGIWLGAIVSLLIGIVLSKKAIRKHQLSSKFRF
ncbi:MAG: PrsW family intramembrane metalloprotease [Flavobacteriaceae bacterium]|nr:MAG: PrsW family intramembrane metalloprotease [Flavobacteriaceae bacterium]